MKTQKMMVRHKRPNDLLRKLDSIYELAISQIPYCCFGEKKRFREDYNLLREKLGFKRKY